MLREFLQYELCSAERHRRYVSLVMVHSPTNHQGLKGMMGGHVRKGDAMADFDHSVAVLMGETDQSDALSAVKRYEGILGNQFDARYSVATFPADDSSADALLETASRRLQKAMNGGNGHVVYGD